MKANVFLAAMLSTALPLSRCFLVNNNIVKNVEAAAKSGTRVFAKPIERQGNWEAHYDEVNSCVYYFNAVTAQSLWEPPAGVSFAKIKTSVKEEKREQLAREGNWGMFYDEKNSCVYYFNLKTGESSWEKPKGCSFEGVLKRGRETAVARKSSKGLSLPLFGKFGDAVAPEPATAVEQELQPKSYPEPVLTPGGPPNPLSSLLQPMKKSKADRVEIRKATEVLKVASSTVINPHPEKVSWGGEDATFLKTKTFGVFDGVSGAEKVEGMPLYSATLASEMKKLITANGNNESLNFDQLYAYMRSARDTADATSTGASTALAGSIGDDNVLRVLNVGDCKCIVVRDRKIYCKTLDIIHSYDCPYQFADESPDEPEDGSTMEVMLARGDLVIVASDGVFDNFNDSDMIKLINSSPSTPSALASKISKESRRISFDANADTPYARNAKAERVRGFESGKGGKLDDVSVVVLEMK